MDALSEVLKSVRMTGAIFYHAECTAPWGFPVPPLQKVAHVLAPGTERLVSYHLVTEAKATVRFAGEEDIPLQPGDILMIPHGDGHTVSNGSPATFLDSAASLGKYPGGQPEYDAPGGGGEMTRFVCGYFGCERHADRLFLAGLPLMIKINCAATRPANGWNARSATSSPRPPRRDRANGPPVQDGGGALHRDDSPLHGRCRRRISAGWRVRGIRSSGRARGTAPQATASLDPGRACHRERRPRSVLAESFTRFLGEPPLTYLARWRLQLAARLLRRRETRAACGVRGRLRFGSGFQSRFQTRVWHSAGTIPAVVLSSGINWWRHTYVPRVSAQRHAPRRAPI